MNFVVIVRAIDKKGELTQDRSCNVYGPFRSREEATHCMDADISPITPSGFCLGVYPMQSLPDKGTRWSVEQMNEFFVIRVVYEDEPYLYRYAYSSEERATQVKLQCIAGFGEPNGVDRDLAANYYHTRKPAIYEFAVSEKTGRIHILQDFTYAQRK